MILEKNAESLENTEVQILTRPVPATRYGHAMQCMVFFLIREELSSCGLPTRMSASYGIIEVPHTCAEADRSKFVGVDYEKNR